jgi:hypothetical protein
VFVTRRFESMSHILLRHGQLSGWQCPSTHRIHCPLSVTLANYGSRVDTQYQHHGNVTTATPHHLINDRQSKRLQPCCSKTHRIHIPCLTPRTTYNANMSHPAVQLYTTSHSTTPATPHPITRVHTASPCRAVSCRMASHRIAPQDPGLAFWPKLESQLESRRVECNSSITLHMINHHHHHHFRPIDRACAANKAETPRTPNSSVSKRE